MEIIEILRPALSIEEMEKLDPVALEFAKQIVRDAINSHKTGKILEQEFNAIEGENCDSYSNFEKALASLNQYDPGGQGKDWNWNSGKIELIQPEGWPEKVPSKVFKITVY